MSVKNNKRVLFMAIILVWISTAYQITQISQVVQNQTHQTYSENTYSNQTIIILQSYAKIYRNGLFAQDIKLSSLINSSQIVMAKHYNFNGSLYVLLASFNQIFLLKYQNGALNQQRSKSFGNVVAIEAGIKEFYCVISTNQLYLIRNNYLWEKLNIPANPKTLKFDTLRDNLLIYCANGQVYKYQKLTTINNLLGFWSFMDFDATQVFDASDYGRHGTFRHSNPTNSSAFNIVQNNNQVIQEHGDFSEDVYVEPINFPFLGTQSFTICLWFLTTNDNTIQALIGDDSETSFGYQVLLNPSWLGQGSLIFYIDEANTRILNTETGQYLPNVWYFAAFVVDRNVFHRKIYLNNVIMASITGDTGTDQTQTVSRLKFGGRIRLSGANQLLQGKMDQVMIFDKVLTIDELNQILDRRTTQKIWLQQTTNQLNLVAGQSLDSKIIKCQPTGNIIFQQNNRLPMSYQIHSTNVTHVVYLSGNSKTLIRSTGFDGFVKSYNLNSSTVQFQLHIPRTNWPPLALIYPFYFAFLNGSNYFSFQFGSNRRIEWGISLTGDNQISTPSNTTQFNSTSINQTMPMNRSQNFNCHFSCLGCTNEDSPFKCIRCASFYSVLFLNGTLQFICVLDCGKKFNKINRECVERLYQIIFIVDSVSKILSIPTVRATVKVLYPILIYLEDLWFYSYHNNNYSVFIQAVFQEIKRLNELEIIPQILPVNEFDQKLDNVSKKVQNEYKPYLNNKLKERNLYKLSFCANTIPIFFWSTSGCLTIFTLLFLLKLILDKFKDKWQLIEFVYDSVNLRVAVSFLLVSIIENNIASLSFYTFIQLQLPSFHDTQGKYNMLGAYLSLYVLVLYSIAFYLLVMKFCTKQQCESLLNYTKWHFRSFILGSYMNAIRFLLNGFLHSYLVDNYQLQITLLLTVNALQVFSILYYRKCYQYKFDMLISLFYNVAFTVLDASFLIGLFNQNLIDQINKNRLQTSLIITMTVASALLFLSQLVVPIYFLLKRKCCSNKVKQKKNSQKTKGVKPKPKVNKKNTQSLFKKQVFQQKSLKQQSIDKDQKNCYKYEKDQVFQYRDFQTIGPNQKIKVDQRNKKKDRLNPKITYLIETWNKEEKARNKQNLKFKQIDQRTQIQNNFRGIQVKNAKLEKIQVKNKKLDNYLRSEIYNDRNLKVYNKNTERQVRVEIQQLRL